MQGDNSSSRKLAKEFLEAYQISHPGVEVKDRDLTIDILPHIDGETLGASYVPIEARSEAQEAKHQKRLELINEITGASAIVVSAPMWNWGPPSNLKAYIDHIVLPGVLDPYGNGKLAGKPVTCLTASGGSYSEDSGSQNIDFETNWLTLIFTKLGATDVTVIRSEFALGGLVSHTTAEQKEAGFQEAKTKAISRASSI